MIKHNSCLGSSPETEQLASVFKALGHPVRLTILSHLTDKAHCCCGELCACFDFSQSTVSQHIGVLKDAGILHARKDGNRMVYSLDREKLKSIVLVIDALTNSHDEQQSA